jgi:hypothetical protein
MTDIPDELLRLGRSAYSNADAACRCMKFSDREPYQIIDTVTRMVAAYVANQIADAIKEQADHWRGSKPTVADIYDDAEAVARGWSP